MIVLSCGSERLDVTWPIFEKAASANATTSSSKQPTKNIHSPTQHLGRDS